MRGVLVDCPKHGIVEDSFWQLDESSDIGFEGSYGLCTVCGALAPVLDGVYGESGGVMTANVRLSKQQAHRLKQSLQWAAERKITEEADAAHVARVLERTLEENAPQVKPWLDKFRGSTSMAVATWIATLTSVITLILTFYVSSGQSISGDQLEQILERALDEQRSQEGPVAPTQSAPPPPGREEPPPSSGGPAPKTR